jgi:hypothetical protein
MIFTVESTTGLTQLAVRVAELLSGFFSVMPQIRDSFIGPRFDQGYPELYPSFQQLASGEVVLRAYKQPPEGVQIPVTASTAAAE